jgi:chaperone modulatory protein CbpM
MITIDVLVSQTAGLNRAELERWIFNDWVRPGSIGETLSFDEIDIARVILIQELRDDLEVNDAALPIVLSLIDQLYDLRRHMRLLGEVMQEAVPTKLRTRVLRELAARKP